VLQDSALSTRGKASVKNPEFASFRKTLDAKMKHLMAAPGIQSAPKKAEPILESEEEILWEKGLLGSHLPQSLIDTMVFMAGLYFALGKSIGD
jgi:hypothetical protein